MRNKRIRSSILFVLSALIILGCGLYFRFYPLTHYIDSDSYEKGTLLVVSRLRTRAAQQVAEAFPRLSGPEKDRLAKEQFDRIMREENENVRKTIDVASRNVSRTRASKPPFYLLGSDSYNYYGLTKRIVQKGAISDTFKGSKFYNELMVAPLGHMEPLNLHPFAGYLLYRILEKLDPTIPLMTAVSLTPVILAALALLAFLIVCSILDYPKWSALIGSFLFFCSPTFLKRSAFGWYDNDPYNVLFPLVILGLILAGLRKIHDVKQSVLLAILCGLSMTLYAYFWHGWVFLFGLLLTAGFFIILYHSLFIKEPAIGRHLFLYFLAFSFTTILGITFCFGLNEFFVLFQEGFKALKNFTNQELSLWPNLYIAVGELRRLPLDEILALNGQKLFFVFSLLGFVVAGFKAFRSPNPNRFSTIILGVLITSCFYLTLNAQRFALLLLVPLSLFFIEGLRAFVAFFKNLIVQRFASHAWPRITFLIMGIGLLGVMATTCLRSAQVTMVGWRAIYHDTWDRALEFLKNNTPKESIITSWWPPGHFITSMSERRVTFDGATLNQPQAYWVAYLLITDNEKEAAGILRMLNTSANGAVEYLQVQGWPLAASVDLLRKIVVQNIPEAGETLKNASFSGNQIKEILKLTHGQPPPSYIFLYNELIEKNIELSFVGRWNFQKIEDINKNKQKLAKVAREPKYYVKYIWDLIGGPPRYSTLAQLSREGQKVIFEQGVMVDIKDLTCRIASAKYGQGTPRSLFTIQNNRVIEKVFPAANLSYSALLLSDEHVSSCVLLDTYLAQSIFARLFFFDAKGLKYFTPFYAKRNLTGRTHIKIFKVDWDRFFSDLNSSPHP
ncbi:MAG: STT3 domain-containing protein [Candidatus Omnitrophota bacterium]